MCFFTLCSIFLFVILHSLISHLLQYFSKDEGNNLVFAVSSTLPNQITTNLILFYLLTAVVTPYNHPIS